MANKSRIILLLLAAFIALLVAGCRDSSGGSGNASPQEAPPQKVSIAAAAPGGSLYLSGSALAKLFTEKLGLDASVESTGGTVQNYQLINQNAATLGITLTIDAHMGWNGEAEWTSGKKMQDVRAIVPMYPDYMQMIARAGSGIKTTRDLAGKTIALGPAGSGHDSIWRLYLNSMDIKPARIVNVPLSDAADMFRDGRIDAIGIISTMPNSTFSDLETTNEVTYVGMPKKDLEEFITRNPWAVPGVIKKGDYKQLSDDIDTVITWVFLIGNKELPDDFVYQITKGIYENVDVLVRTYNKMADVKPINVINLNIPLHPGALKYYQEIGLSVPEKLRP